VLTNCLDDETLEIEWNQTKGPSIDFSSFITNDTEIAIPSCALEAHSEYTLKATVNLASYPEIVKTYKLKIEVM